MDKKRRTYLFVILGIILVMFWAFISAGVITSNFNRAQVKTGANDQKVDAIGIIITETKDGKKYMFYCGNGYGYGGIGVAVACNNRVYARGTELFATYKGERYDLTIDVTVNGEALPASEWKRVDSDCNTWRETEINGVRVRVIVTHTLDGLRVFCTAVSNGGPANVTACVKFGEIATASDSLTIAENETKMATIDLALD